MVTLQCTFLITAVIFGVIVFQMKENNFLEIFITSIEWVFIYTNIIDQNSTRYRVTTVILVNISEATQKKKELFNCFVLFFSLFLIV